MIRWDAPDPVFFDLETQSAADLRAVGGRLYAAHATTRLLSAVFLIDGVYHVWMPAPAVEPVTAGKVRISEIWPDSHGPRPPIELHHGADPPAAVAAAVAADRTFVAHNCFGFDRFVWRAVIAPRLGGAEPPWADTLPLARAAGYPGRLDALGKSGAGVGKDTGHRILMKLCKVDGDTYPAVGAGQLEVVLRYNVADVDLLRRAWGALAGVPVEADVIAAHDAINDRGVAVAPRLIDRIRAVAAASVTRAADRIEELTEGRIKACHVGSAPKVKQWLSDQGLRIRDHTGKSTLRKDAVAQALANPWLMLDADAPVEAAGAIRPEVFEVLRLRAAALRITGAKADRAIERSPDGRARDLFAYHQAHTGRWSSTGIQVHNLPRPRKGVPVQQLLELMETPGKARPDDLYAAAAALLPAGLTVDDGLSALLRPMFCAGPGRCLVMADFNAIECRGVAWLAGEENLLQIFRDGGDPYRWMGSKLFGKPSDQITDVERQIAKVTVLGCGYQLSDNKFGIYCGLQGVDLTKAGTTPLACVDAFRSAFPRIAGARQGVIDGKPYRSGGLWHELNRAAVECVQGGGMRRAGRCAFVRDGSTLLVELPSGRRLHYRNARVEDRIPAYAAALGLDRAKATLVYTGPQGDTTLYGGKVAENITQAVCRDLLATAIVRLEAAGLPVVLHVHDEIVCEVPEDQAAAALDTLLGIMAEPPPWAAGFPVAVEGFAAPRYGKSPPAGWPSGKRRG